MELRIVADRDVIRHGLSQAIQVAPQEQNFVVIARPAVEAITQCRNQRALRAEDERQFVRQDLKDVVAPLTEKEITRLTVLAARQDIVFRSSKDPLFTRAPGQHILARPTQDHVTA